MSDLQISNRSAAPVAAATQVEQERAIQEVQAQMVIAKKFPRDLIESYNKIMAACQRPSLANGALYAYPRGSETVTGPSIRLAEVIAQNWGNFEYGVRELSQRDGVSEMEAYAWDKETNTRATKIFHVKHERHTKNGSYALTDPRDIYEMTANQGMRRVRACILGMIPPDVIEAAVSQCERTLANAGGDKPLIDQAREMVTAFDKFGVTQSMIEKRLGHKLDAIQPAELQQLRKIFQSLRDNASSVEQWFDHDAAADATAAIQAPTEGEQE